MSAPPAAPPAAAASADAGDDWRRSVPQSYRSEEVRNIAKVLASLEPGATSASKLMLAMRFEDAIFQNASALSDYRKKLTKRLKKVQKSYKPPSEADSASAADTSGLSAAEAARRKDLEVERSLRAQFGDELRFIVLHAAEAVEAMKEKHGSSRAEVLRQHTDNAEQWAVEIALDGCDTPSYRARRRRVPREAGYLDRLRTHLEQRVDNIRSHVVKLTRPDLFLEETLVRLEDDMSDATADALAAVTKAALARTGHAAPASDAAGVRRLLERATAPAPIPRRGRKGDIRDASLAHVEKVRAASQALVGYMALDHHGKAEVKGLLKRAHAAAVESVSHLAGSGAGFEEDGRAEGEVRLEDAWNRAMEYKSEKEEAEAAVAAGTGTDETAAMDAPDGKRQRTDSAGGGRTVRNAVVIRSKVLLSPGRTVPSNLRAALRRKKAELIQPPGNVADYVSTRIRLEFGSAFDMTVNFTPLLVTIRAMPEQPAAVAAKAGTGATLSPDDEEEDTEAESDFRRTVVDGGLPTSVPPTRGLRGRGGPGAAPRPLSVLGVPGTAATVGHLVAKKLEYASAHATHVLRRCFADLAGRAYAKPDGSDFEIEILESTALLRFLQIARSTYCPGWQDGDS